ncbi:MAG TPA: Arm DNA-binding domain-containing protein [Azospirillum sp.]|nr:Arm DNA-binding domain-containing protein [Azospirillum sp.]
MAVMKLTKRSVEAAAPGTYFDTDIPGFGLRVDPTGNRTYFIKLKVRDGAQRKPTIGRHGIVTCDQARDRARDLYIRARDGEDPIAERCASACNTGPVSGVIGVQ